MLRIGHKGIVSFPNYSHWGIRLQVIFTGYAPFSRQLPYPWYETPNIRVITLKDFRKFVHEVGMRVLAEVAIDTHSQDRYGRIIAFLPNLRATYGIYLIATPAARVAWIFGQRPKRQKHVSACSVTFAKANNLVS